MIEVRHLNRRFSNLVAVDDLSFKLEPGEVVGFLGPNGAGKTTTMRMLTGYLPATSAEKLTVAGHDVLRQSMEVRKRIGYLPESVPLYRELRVREMMLFQGRLHGLSRRELRERVPAVLERVGVLDRERQLVGKLSRGLRQRVGLAVALLPRPEVLILDEPTSGLDPIQRGEVRSLIRELADEHTVLLSSHILAEVESIARRVMIVHEGRLVADGSQQELVERIGGPGHVRFEAVVGDGEEARTLLASLPEVERVEVGEKVGIHQAFRIHGQGDLREDVGALAMTRSWAVRELSWNQPTLGEIFSRLVLGGEGVGELGSAGSPAGGDSASKDSSAGAAAPSAAPVELAMADPSSTTTMLPLAEVAAQPAPGAPAAEAPAAQAPAGGASGPAPSSGGAPPLGTPGRKKVIYSLNPFDQGASRDLGKPMAVEPTPGVEASLEADLEGPAGDAGDDAGGEPPSEQEGNR